MPREKPQRAHLRLELERHVHRKAKATAIARGQSVSDLVTELVEQLPDDIHFEKELQPT